MARHHQVDAAVDGLDFGCRRRLGYHRVGLGRQRRQLGRQLEGDIAAPQPHQAGEGFALAPRREPGLGEPRTQLGIEGGKLRLIELVAAAGLAELCVQPGRRVDRGARLVEKAHLLLGGDRPDVRPARVGGEAQGGPDRLMPGVFEMLGGDLGPAGQREQAENVLDQPELEIGDAGAGDVHERHARIGRQACLHVGRFGDAEIVVGGLKIAVVEKRRLNGRVGRQRLCQQRGDRCFACSACSTFVILTTFRPISAPVSRPTPRATSSMPPSAENLAQPARRSREGKERNSLLMARLPRRYTPCPPSPADRACRPRDRPDHPG